MKLRNILAAFAALCVAASLTACQTDDTDAVESADDTDSSVTLYASQVAASDTDSEADTFTDSDMQEDYSSYTEEASSAEEVSSEETEYIYTDEDESDTEEDDTGITGSWTAQYIVNEDNEAVDGSMIYGTAYTQYGGTLTLNTDGTFSVRMGVGTDDDSTTGTYTFEENVLTLEFYDDSVTECEYVESYDGTVITMPIDLFGDEYTVYFAMSY